MQLLDVNGEPTAYLHIHMAIFLELGPKSLKSASQVSRDLDEQENQEQIREEARQTVENETAHEERNSVGRREKGEYNDDVL